MVVRPVQLVKLKNSDANTGPPVNRIKPINAWLLTDIAWFLYKPISKQGRFV